MTFETKLTISSAVSRMVTTVKSHINFAISKAQLNENGVLSQMNMQRLAQANTESYDTFGDDKNTTESEAVQSD